MQVKKAIKKKSDTLKADTKPTYTQPLISHISLSSVQASLFWTFFWLQRVVDFIENCVFLLRIFLDRAVC